MCLADFFIYEINFKVFSGHLKQKSSVALQVTGCRSIVAAASGCHQNCLEAMSCVKTIEVIFEESRCHKIYYCFFVTGMCYIYMTVPYVHPLMSICVLSFFDSIFWNLLCTSNPTIGFLIDKSLLIYNTFVYLISMELWSARMLLRNIFSNLLPDAYVILLTNTQLFPQEGKSVSDDKIVGKIVKK